VFAIMVILWEIVMAFSKYVPGPSTILSPGAAWLIAFPSAPVVLVIGQIVAADTGPVMASRKRTDMVMNKPRFIRRVRGSVYGAGIDSILRYQFFNISIILICSCLLS